MAVAANHASPPAAPPRPRRRFWWLLALAMWFGVHVVLWLWLPPRPRVTLETTPLSEPMMFSADGTRLVTGPFQNSANGAPVEVWDVATGARQAARLGDWPQVFAGGVSPDGRWHAFLDYTGGRLLLVDLDTGEELTRPFPVVTGDFSQFQPAFAPDGRAVAHAVPGGGIEIFDLNARRVRGTTRLGVSGPLAFSADGAMLAAVARDSGRGARVILCDVTTARSLRECPVVHWPIHQLAFAPDGEQVAASGLAADATGANVACIWDISTGHVAHHFADVCGVAWVGERSLATLRQNAGVVVWDTVRGTEDRVIACPFGWRRSWKPPVAAGGRWVTIYGDDGSAPTACHRFAERWLPYYQWQQQPEAAIIDTHAGRRRGVLPVRWLAAAPSLLSPDGRTWAVASDDGRIHLWDVPPRRPIAPFVPLLVADALLLALWLVPRRGRAAA